jgi:hypothetical protein
VVPVACGSPSNATRYGSTTALVHVVQDVAQRHAVPSPVSTARVYDASTGALVHEYHLASSSATFRERPHARRQEAL